MKKLFLLIGMVLIINHVFSQEPEIYSGPIIDMHLHAYSTENFWGPAPNPSTGEISVSNPKDHYEQCIAMLKKHKIVLAMVDCESPADLEPWLQILGDAVVIKGFRKNYQNISQFKNWVSKGKIELFGEVAPIYVGHTPIDSVFLPYYEICEEYDIPVGIHTGGSLPGITNENKDFRLSLGDPFFVEDILVNYPKLRVYLMHAGAHFYERTAMLMVQYPNLYVDIAVLNWVPDANNFLSPFLKLAKTYKVLDRVMYGSDQMIWPEAIEMAIKNVQSLDFLTLEEKKDIFYDNAACFLRLPEDEIKRHHNH
jgi:uncharacterized protein